MTDLIQAGFKSSTQLLMSAFVFVATLIANPAVAQNYQPSYQGGDYVTVYEDCDFRGKSRALTVGNYDDVRNVDIGNDEISSIQVPRGMNIVLYEDERQRGKSTVISSDVSCLNRTWNDQASSFQVNYDDSARSYDNNRGYDNRRDDNRGYQNRTGHRGNNNDQGSDYNRGGRDLTSIVESVEYSNTTLTRGQGGEWIASAGRAKNSTFRETGRDNGSIYLQHNRYDQRIEINMVQNRVILQSGNGQKLDYPITRLNAQQANRKPVIKPSILGQNRRIPSACFNYRAYTSGGEGGVRFHGHDGFHQFSRKGRSDRICHNGSLVMEINKKEPGTEVVVEINNEKYRFAANEKADAYLNTWYRKKITLVVGK